MSTGDFLIVINVFASIINAINAQQLCPPHHGLNVEFDYSETKNEKVWYDRYKGGYKKPSKFVPIFQQNSLNDFQQQNFFPQQQQQQLFAPLQQQANIEPSTRPPTTTEGPTTTTTEFVPLPIWKLKIPRNTQNIVLRTISDGALGSNTIKLSELDSLSNITEHSSSYYKTMDITEYDVEGEQWYLIELDLRFVDTRDKEQGVKLCKYHALAYACTKEYGSCNENIMDKHLRRDQSTATQAVVRYRSLSIPLPHVTVVSSIRLVPEYRRCAPQVYDVDLQTREFTMYPNSMADVSFDVLAKEQEYQVQTTIKFRVNVSGVDGASDKNVVINDFLFDDNVEISDCSSRSFKVPNLAELIPPSAGGSW